MGSFRGRHTFEFSPRLNYVVGDNNCGKSTLFHALAYLVDQKVNNGTFFTTGVESDRSVEATFAGPGLRELVQSDTFKAKMSAYLYTEDGEDRFTVQRSPDPRTVSQGKKTVDLTEKTICFWSQERQQYENASGIDALFRKFLLLEPVWADSNPSDLVDFSPTKTLGKMVRARTSEFFESGAWADFVTAHKSAFSDGSPTSLESLTKPLATEIEEIVTDQYGPVTVGFSFDVPDPSTFTKMGEVSVDDGGGVTALGDKGTGLQRAFALGLIQLYAQSGAAEQEYDIPLFFILDEPETWLHPSAQLRLSAALTEIAQSQQLFLVTHSPYMLKNTSNSTHDVLVFTKDGSAREHRSARNLILYKNREPTWGGINYFAFDLPSVEFHDELYGVVVEHVRAGFLNNGGKTGEFKDTHVQNYLRDHGIKNTCDWTGKASPFPVSVCTYVRNSIHHPENMENPHFTDAQLRESTELLIPLVERIIEDQDDAPKIVDEES